MGTKKKKQQEAKEEGAFDPEAPSREELQGEIEELKRQLAEKTDLAQGYFAQLQRVQADFENYQRRIDSEKARIADSACETIVSGLLETLDNFERAISFLDKLPPEESRGVQMVYENMLSYLKTNGLERIAATGCAFDPRRHDAIMQAEVDSGEDGAVLEEFQAGYTVKGKVIRPAKVKVARVKNVEDEENKISKEE